MGRPKKPEEPILQTIALQDFENMWSKFKGWQPSVAMELSPMWERYKNSDPTAQERLYNQRRAQLHQLDMLDTHVIDFYADWHIKKLQVNLP